MPAVTLRLRLSIAAFTLAAAISGIFLVSSAPAQTTALPPAVPTAQNHSSLRSAGRTANKTSQLAEAQFLAGLTPVQGPGVVVTLRNSRKPFPGKLPAGLAAPNLIHDIDINQVVNGLRAAGAEAIAVNNQRLVATSAVRAAGPTIFINNTPEAPPFVIKAIGNPKALYQVLNIPGGIASQITAYDKAMFTVQKSTKLTLPAYTGADAPRYAKPASAAAVPTPPAPQSKVIVTLDSKGIYFLDGVRVPENRIEPMLAARVRQNPKMIAVIKAAKNQPYSRVVELLDLAKQAGVRGIDINSLPSGPPPSAKPAASGAASAAAPTRMIAGYGLVSFMLSKRLYCHAVEHSEADRLGISTERVSEIIGVNGRPIPQSEAQFAAICRAAPPLRLLLKPAAPNSRKAQLVTFQTKAPFSVVTDAARAEDLGKAQKSAQADLETAEAALTHANQQLTDGIHTLLPQVPPATLAKALNLERQIGWSMDRMRFAAQYLAWSQKKHNPKSRAMAANLEENVRTYLDPETAEEARLFPQTADSRRQLTQIHVLTEHIGNIQTTVTDKRIEASALASVMQQRSPDTSL